MATKIHATPGRHHGLFFLDLHLIRINLKSADEPAIQPFYYQGVTDLNGFQA